MPSKKLLARTKRFWCFRTVLKVKIILRRKEVGLLQSTHPASQNLQPKGRPNSRSMRLIMGLQNWEKLGTNIPNKTKSSISVAEWVATWHPKIHFNSPTHPNTSMYLPSKSKKRWRQPRKKGAEVLSFNWPKDRVKLKRVTKYPPNDWESLVLLIGPRLKSTVPKGGLVSRCWKVHWRPKLIPQWKSTWPPNSLSRGPRYRKKL